MCSPGALHHSLSNHIKSASNWVRTLLSSSLDISIVCLYLYEIPHGYIDIAHIWKRSDVFAQEVDLLPADRRDSFGKFLISQVDRGNLKCLVGTKFERGSYRGSDLRREQGTRDYLPPLHTGDTRHASVFLSKLDFSPPPNNICAFFSWGFVSFQSVFLARTGVLVCLEGPPTLGVRTSAFGKEELYYLWAAHIFVHSFNSGSCFTSSWWKRLSIRVRGAPGGGWQGHQQQPS